MAVLVWIVHLIIIIFLLIFLKFGCANTVCFAWCYISIRCLKTINSKKYGVDLVCFTAHPTTVIYSSKNGWDGEWTWWCYLYSMLWLPLIFSKLIQNLCGFCLSMIINICGTLKGIMIGMPICSLTHIHWISHYEDNLIIRFVFIFFFRVVSLSLCPGKESFVSGSLDRTVLLWDQRAEKSQVRTSK